MSTNPPTLTREQFGEGVKGAARTAGYLADNGVDARIGELPQPGAEKVDVDDYLSVITVGYETYLCRTPNPPTLEGGRGYPLSPFGGGGLGVIENGRTGWSE
jgi:hypothetical protein